MISHESCSLPTSAFDDAIRFRAVGTKLPVQPHIKDKTRFLPLPGPETHSYQLFIPVVSKILMDGTQTPISLILIRWSSQHGHGLVRYSGFGHENKYVKLNNEQRPRTTTIIMCIIRPGSEALMRTFRINNWLRAVGSEVTFFKKKTQPPSYRAGGDI